ncbi:MAG: hypothetical protein DYH18_07955 [Xanthomonadales bacterium PRO7]|nr:hypothetical protein [Xanthomonadales bacterium PRO7]
MVFPLFDWYATSRHSGRRGILTHRRIFVPPSCEASLRKPVASQSLPAAVLARRYCTQTALARNWKNATSIRALSASRANAGAV